MRGEDIRGDVVVVGLVLLYGAVVADQLPARLAVELKVLTMLGTAQDPPLEREHLGGVFDHPGDGDDVVTGQLAPQLVGLDALVAYVLPAVAAEGSSAVLLALLALAVLQGVRPREDISDVEEVMDVVGGK